MHRPTVSIGVLRALVGTLAGALLVLAAAAQPLDATLHEQVVRVPVPGGGPSGETVEIEATVYRPEGPGPFPLLVLSHGSPRGGDEARRRMGRVRFLAQAAEFVRMGFVVIVPTRRGFGNSGGHFAENAGHCDSPDYRRAGLEAARDLLAAIEHMRREPYVDASRIVLAGQSAGGFASLAAASRQPPGVVAVLNFAGGRGSQRPDFVCSEHLLVAAFGDYGAGVRVPTFWHYAENDRFFAPELVRRMHEAFRAGGAAAELVMQPPFGVDGHAVFSSAKGTPVWLPPTRAFLQSIGLLP